jgi:predicted HTH transcriptional regulator
MIAMNSETNRIEYKLNLNEKLERSVVAFLNYHEGGVIYIGMDDDGTSIGIDNADETQLQIVNRIRDNIRPSVLGLFDVLTESRDEKTVIKIIISSGTEKPYYIRSKGRSESGCFIRVGSSVQPMTLQMIDELYRKRNPAALGMMRAPRGDLTFRQLKIFYEGKGLELNERFKNSLELLTEDGKDNYIAYLLADENAVSMKVAKYAGTDKVDLIENAEYGYCCLIKAAGLILDKLTVENKTFAKITPTVRLEKNMVNRVALREAVINSIVHNDYSSGVTPLIEIYSDRITVTSYGGLVEGMTQEDFFACYSRPRNRELMRVFKDMELVEQIGSGMSRILKAYDRSIFSFTPNFLTVSFPIEEGFANNFSGEPVNGTDGILNGTINDTDGIMNGTINSSKILAVLADNPQLSIEQISASTGIAKRTIAREMKRLRDNGIIKRIGSKKTGYWEIISSRGPDEKSGYHRG